MTFYSRIDIEKNKTEFLRRVLTTILFAETTNCQIFIRVARVFFGE